MAKAETKAGVQAGKSRSTTSADKAHALLNPRNAVIVGASDRPGNWAWRAWRNLKREGFKGAIFPYNPSRDTVWDERCYRSFSELPEPPDHLVVVIPARLVPATLRDAAAHGARSATVFSSGFGESPGPEGARLEAELKAAIEETGLAVSGPNCLGNISADASYVSMIEDRRMTPVLGPVAIVGQSGGIVMAIRRTLAERGVDTRILVTSGNETGLNAADYVSYFAEHPGLRVIVVYLESLRNPAGFMEACRKARAQGKSVVVLKLGATDEGRKAAMAHTGALAGSMAAFDAVASEAGIMRARNLDEVVEAVEFLVHAPLPKGGRIGAITLSGGFRGLIMDLAADHKLMLPALGDASRQRLEKVLGVGSIVGNPLDAGYAALTNPNALVESVEVMLADPGIDILLVQEEVPRAPDSEMKQRNMRAVNEMAAEASKPVAFITMISHGLNDYSREFRGALRNVPFLQEPDKALGALAMIARQVSRPALAAVATGPGPTPAQAKALASLEAGPGPLTLDEVRSKALLAAYGIKPPREEVAHSAEEAVAIAGRIGFPVVAKAVCAALPHKSDAGAVIVGIRDAAALRAAYAEIAANVARLPAAPKLDGILVAEMVSGGLELVLGAQHDPEVGPVVLFGRGGVEIELMPDTALGAAPLDEARALALIERTRVSALINGFRGRPALNKDTLVKALIGISHLMVHAGGRIQSIETNPFLLSAAGGVALDALVVRANTPKG